jgi:hypothetical protein
VEKSQNALAKGRQLGTQPMMFCQKQHGELIFPISNHPSFLDLYGFEAGPPANNWYFA